MPIAPSGEQFRIAYGEQSAVIVEVGGGIRAYEDAGRRVLDPYPLEAMSDGGHGSPLIPWPNRLAGGRYTWDGETYQLALSEPTRDNAAHGLLRWRSWRCLERTTARVVMGTTLHPLPGWPFPLEVQIAYELGEEGLLVETRARNLGEADAPFAAGQHPYLSAGSGRVDECVLQFAAAERILTDPERQLPAGREPVAGGDYDFSAGRAIGTLQIDHAFVRAGDTVRLRGRDGRTVELWVDDAYPLIQLYTGDTLAPPRRRLGLACEPMSAPPNALASGEGLVRLAPGGEWVGRWGVRLR